MKVWIKFSRNGRSYQIDRPEQDTARGGFWIFSRAKVCPHCLQVWATLTTEKGAPYGIECQPCLICSSSFGNGVPGSLIDDRVSHTVDWDLIRYLPVELLQREFDLHIRMIEKDSENERSFDSTTAVYSPGAGAFDALGSQRTS